MGIMGRLVKWSRLKSPWICHFNTGGCNGCDIEVVAALTPRFDVERFGILLQGSPRHADVLVCTGPVTRQLRDRVKRLYAQTPDPKFVMAIGSCAESGGVFRGCYSVEGGMDSILPVDVYVAGCPPRPDSIINGVVKILEKIDKGELPKGMTEGMPEKKAGEEDE